MPNSRGFLYMYRSLGVLHFNGAGKLHSSFVCNRPPVIIAEKACPLGRGLPKN